MPRAMGKTIRRAYGGLNALFDPLEIGRELRQFEGSFEPISEPFQKRIPTIVTGDPSSEARRL